MCIKCQQRFRDLNKMQKADKTRDLYLWCPLYVIMPPITTANIYNIYNIPLTSTYCDLCLLWPPPTMTWTSCLHILSPAPTLTSTYCNLQLLWPTPTLTYYNLHLLWPLHTVTSTYCDLLILWPPPTVTSSQSWPQGCSVTQVSSWWPVASHSTPSHWNIQY